VNPAGFISTLFLEGISTINSIPFPNPNPQVSTLVIGGPGSLSTSFIYGLVNINGAPYPPPGLREIQVSTITLAPNGFVSTLQLEGVSSINGVAYPPPGLGSIQVSSMTVASSGFISTPQLRTTARSAITIGEDPLATNNSGFILFNSSGHDTFDTGQTSLNKNSGLVNRNEPNSTISGLYVAVISTGLSTAQPLGCSEVYLYGVANSGSVLPVTLGYDNSIPALTVQAPSVNISSLVGVSSINGVAYPPPGGFYTLSGTTAGAVIVNRATGAGNPLTQNVFTNVSQITFNIPPGWTATNSVSYDGYAFFDFNANFNSFWGITYYTNTVATPTDILGSTTATANALNFPNNQQIYLPLNLIVPPTNLSAGGTITLTFFCNPTSINHYITADPTNIAKIAIIRD
jgi:hypothetical protein